MSQEAIVLDPKYTLKKTTSVTSQHGEKFVALLEADDNNTGIIRNPSKAISGTVKAFKGKAGKIIPELQDLTGEELHDIIGEGRNDLDDF
jgi:hypothetical protein